MKLLLLSILLTITSSFYVEDIDWLNKREKQKLEKTITKIWKDKLVLKKEVIVPLYIQKTLKTRVKEQTLYKILIEDEIEAFLFLDSKQSKFDTFDYMVILDKNLNIIKVNILEYREDYGGEICSNVFLKQFINKNYKSNISLGNDIQGISGATISCRSAVNGVKNITKKAVILKKEGYL
jgi:Na+-translocating ferredoxin:NAD+ oxidoreductase RnfG subunit